MPDIINDINGDKLKTPKKSKVLENIEKKKEKNTISLLKKENGEIDIIAVMKNNIKYNSENALKISKGEIALSNRKWLNNLTENERNRDLINESLNTTHPRIGNIIENVLIEIHKKIGNTTLIEVQKEYEKTVSSMIDIFRESDHTYSTEDFVMDIGDYIASIKKVDKFEGSFFREPDLAFQNAILQGLNPDDYMYMNSQGNKDFFKHHDTREYVEYTFITDKEIEEKIKNTPIEIKTVHDLNSLLEEGENISEELYDKIADFSDADETDTFVGEGGCIGDIRKDFFIYNDNKEVIHHYGLKVNIKDNMYYLDELETEEEPQNDKIKRILKITGLYDSDIVNDSEDVFEFMLDDGFTICNDDVNNTILLSYIYDSNNINIDLEEKEKKLKEKLLVINSYFQHHWIENILVGKVMNDKNIGRKYKDFI